MRRCLINLTRLGDLLQTQPVVHALKARGDDVALVCLENFAEAAGLLHGVDRVAVLPGSSLLAGLANDWRLCAAGLLDWIAAERAAFAPHSVINLTPTISARLLGRLAAGHGPEHACAELEGFGLDDHGFGRDGSPWATYTQAASARRGCSPFNLVDAFRCMTGTAGVEAVYALRRPDEATQHAVEAELAGLAAAEGMAEHAGYVAFQLGASMDARRWPTASFAALGRALRNKADIVPLLLGSPAERDLAARYREHGGPGIDMTGKTDLPRLAAALRACRLLVTNDTGTMHLAAGLGVPVLALFLATAQPWDTGPYAEGACCLEPRLDCHPCPFSQPCPREHACRAAIGPEAVAALILPWLQTGRWQPARRATAEARVWLTTRDERGFLDLASLSGDEEADRTVWIRWQRRFYRHFLDGLQGADTQAGTRGPLPPPLAGERRARVDALLAAADGLLLLAREQGQLLGMRPSDRTRHALLATCERIKNLLEASPDFVPLAYVWRASVHGERADWAEISRFLDALRRDLAAFAHDLSAAR